MRGQRLRVAALGLAIALSIGTTACSGDKDADRQPRPKPTPTATSASATPSPTPKPSPSKAAAYDPITGGKKSSNVVIAAKIDNVAAARPQVGIYKADIVVVERVEADLTRMVAIYHSNFPRRVGPVRSARNTDVQLLPMFGKPGLVFSGANRKVLKQLRHSPYLRPIPRETRDNSRSAPHNVIVHLDNVAKLPDIGKAKPIGYTFGSGPQWKSAAKAPSVKVPIGVDTFGFDYRGGRYRTSWNGQRNTDGDDHKPVLTDNIVRLKVKSHKDTQTTSDLSNVAETVGSGKVTVYSQGKQLTGTWKRSKLNGPMTLKDSHGKDIALKPGKTWMLLDG
ncbi:DUF3048 domain-containing protein [Microlunatus soli]|uniref:DUF3048 domain-containing protein n=1 Tax=Microlunatus soli TaxID=630515 RepID=UPI0012F91736|nr:DUF3048 domain-containing protein [Microlunatus soli]